MTRALSVGGGIAGEMAAADVADLAAGRVLNPSWRAAAGAGHPADTECLLHTGP